MIAFWNKLITEAAKQPHADAELLRRFIDHRDELAFELLLRRHAELVWKVCHGILRHHADAEDAFQSTFLVLARKAKSIRNANVAGWLHRVATNASLKLKAKRLPTTDTALSLSTDNGVSLNDDAAILHEEVERLPERYRLPILLCQLQELTHSQAAIELNWPIGTVAGRLSRAKKLLHKRLLARGVTGLSVATVSVVSPRLLQSAVLVALGQSVASTMVLNLSQGIGASMGLTKLKLTTLALIVGCAVGTGTSVMMISHADEPGQPSIKIKAPISPELKPPTELVKDKTLGSITAFPELTIPKDHEAVIKACPRSFSTTLESINKEDDLLTQLRKHQLAAQSQAVAAIFQHIDMGDANQSLPSTYDMLFQSLDPLYETANIIYGNDPSEWDHWLQERVIVYKNIENFYKERIKVGRSRSRDILTYHAKRLAAEAELLQFLQQQVKPKP